jgi:hypothetical protein
MTSLSPLALSALERARASAAPDKPTSSRKNWSADQEQLLTQLYPDTPMPELIKRLGFTASAIYQKARNLGLRRSPEYLASEHACRLRKGDNVGAEHRFKRGHQSWNAGMHGWQAGGRSAETRFKPGSINGSAAERLKPVGFERVTDDGILQRKIRADGPPHRRWQSVHEIIWEEHNGPRPAGHLVVFKDGNRRNFSPDNLELISRAENCRRNSIHRYPPELKQAIRRLKKLKRTIEEKSNEEPARPD